MTKRRHLVWVLGLTLALGLPAVALGAGNTDNTQRMAVTVTPSKQPKKRFGNAKLRSLTVTGTNGTGAYAITPVDRAVIFYDRDIKFDTNGLPQCRKNLNAKTTAQVKRLCRRAIVGKGQAVVKIAGDPAAPDTATNITAFNGKPSWKKRTKVIRRHGRKIRRTIRIKRPVILLHVYSAALGVDAVQVLKGKLFKLRGKFGWKLVVNVPQLPFGTATTIFNVTVQRKPWITKRRKTVRRGRRKFQKVIRTKHYYVSAKCTHRRWFYKGWFHYKSNAGSARRGSLPASSTQICRAG